MLKRFAEFLVGLFDFNARRRSIDLRILWPTCVECADGDLVRAKAAFAVHAFNDDAWMCLGEDEVRRIIDGLTP